MAERRYTDYIVVHCSDTSPTMDVGVEEIRDWHLERGWADIGYHYVIRRDGRVEEGRHDDRVGAHVKGYNNISLGICLVGGAGGKFDFSRQQLHSLELLLNALLLKYKKAEVVGHREFDHRKDCPGFDVRSYWYGQAA